MRQGSNVSWTPALALLAALWLAVGLIYRDSVSNLIYLWSSTSSYNYCFLIPFISLYVALRDRPVLRRMCPSPAPLAIMLVLVNALLWMVGDAVSIAVVEHIAVIGLLISTTWLALGSAIARRLLFPLLYLYFAVPEGKFLVPYLQDWTATVVVHLLRLVGVPVFIEGLFISIPSGNFVVATACSGINYLLATLAISTVFMYLNFVSYWRRLAFMTMAVIVPLLANGVRAFGIIMIAHLSNYRYAMGIDHFIYGWVFFGVVIFVLFTVGNLFADGPRDDAGDIPQAAPGHAYGVSSLLVSAVAISLMFATHESDGFLRSEQGVVRAVALPSVPGWVGPQMVESTLGTRIRGADTYLSGRYTDPNGVAVILEVVASGSETAVSGLVNQANRSFDEDRWRTVGHRARNVSKENGQFDVEELRIRELANGEMFRVWRWFDSVGVRSASRLRIKLAQFYARLIGRPIMGASIAIRVIEDNGVDPLPALERFASSKILRLEQMSVGR